MEITTRRPSRGSRRAGLALGSVGLLLAIGLLVPATLGLEQQPLADRSFTGSYDRGALLYREAVFGPGEVRPGDVITFAVPSGPAAGRPVARRVVAVDGPEARTRGLQRDQTWRVDMREADVQRVVFAVPLAGHPQLLASWLTWPLIAVLLGLAGAGALGMSARSGARGPVPARPEHEPGPRLFRRPAPTEPAADRAASGV